MANCKCEDRLYRLEDKVQRIQMALEYPTLSGEEGFSDFQQIARKVQSGYHQTTSRLMEYFGLTEVTYPQKVVIEKVNQKGKKNAKKKI